jgi:hypothetical protein
MANPHRGEVDCQIGGRRLTLCLTLGALAEIEDAFGADGLAALAARLQSANLSARDLCRILAAAARGGGSPVTADELAGLPLTDGLTPLLDAVLQLFERTFGAAETAEPRPQRP